MSLGELADTKDDDGGDSDYGDDDNGGEDEEGHGSEGETAHECAGLDIDGTAFSEFLHDL